jgi:hypothetical protein
MTGAAKPRKDFGPVQIAEYLGLSRWQVDRALAYGVLAQPDTPRGRWSAASAAEALGRIDAITAEVGAVPDLGAERAAELLRNRLGVPADGDAVAELARRGLLDIVGAYRDAPLYDGRQLERFEDVAALADARRCGRMRVTGEAAAYLRIRRSDVTHLVRAGLLTPARWGYSIHQPRGTRRVPTVALYRQADLDAVLAAPGIDWDAVRATPPRRPSPLAQLPTLPGTSSAPGVSA